MPPAPDTAALVYRDLHRAVRSALAVAVAVGDADRGELTAALSTALAAVEALRAHERDHVATLLDAIRPDLAARTAADHRELDRAAVELVARAGAPVASPRAAHELHLDAAAFTGAHLLHQDFEERVVLPLLIPTLDVARALRPS